MRQLKKLTRYLVPYRKLLFANVLSNILMAFFTVISIPAIIPFLHILIGTAPEVTETPPFGWSIPELLGWVKYSFATMVEQQGRPTTLKYVCFFIIFIFFFKNLFHYLAAAFMAPIRNGIVSDIRQQLYEKFLDLPLSYYSDERKGDLLSRLTVDVQEVEISILSVMVTVVRDPLIMLGSLMVMIYFSPGLMLFVFGLLIFTVIVIGGIGKRLKRDSAIVQENMGDMISNVEESLSGMKIIKGFAAEKFRNNQFLKINDQYRNAMNRLLWRKDLASPLSEFLGIVVVAGLLWFGAQQVFVKALSAPTFFAFLYAFFNIIAPAKSFSGAYFNVQKGLAAANRIDQILGTIPTIIEEEDPQPFTSFTTSILYDGVGFNYSEVEGNVLENIHLEIPKGKVIALVGASGSGKSTLVDLLVRFYDPSMGRILIDNRDIRTLNLADLRNQLGIVSQEPILFHDTIYNNILFGTKTTNRAAVVEAAKIANAHEFIMATKHGYDSIIGDRGNKLSGGQKQRLTIARAILKNPAILILDEATSALDAESEQLVQDALNKLMENRTAIVIAHRLATIQRADEILVMEAGRITERGNHQRLMDQQGTYYSLVNLQNLEG
jgi:ABC-type multidrug transport system, ATPase and permease components